MTKIEISSVAKFISTIGEKIEGKEGYEFFHYKYVELNYKNIPSFDKSHWRNIDACHTCFHTVRSLRHL